MHYICIENKAVTAILNYKPNVPNDTTVVEISDEHHQMLVDDTHQFNVVTLSVEPRDEAYIDGKKIAGDNAQKLAYLNQTDWMILRHVREKALGLETSLSEDKYLQLEQKRHDVANVIVKQDQ